MGLTGIFSPFGTARFGVLHFLAPLMFSRVDTPTGDAPDGGYTAVAAPMTVPAPVQR